MFLSRQANQFIIAVQEGSLVKAAERISITPSAMSRGIGELECKIGSRLIKRTRNGIKPTEKGEWLYRELLPHYKGIQTLSNKIKHYGSTQVTSIRTDGLYIPRIKEKMLHLLNDNPQHEISFLPGGGDEKPEHVLDDGSVDIYISTNRPETSTACEKITSISMKPELIGVIAQDDIFRGHKDLKSILKKHKVVQTHAANNHKLFSYIRRSLNENGYEFDIFPVADINEVCYLVNEGVGISFMSNAVMDDNVISDKIKFMDMPLGNPIILQRYICFNSENFKAVMDICSVLRDF